MGIGAIHRGQGPKTIAGSGCTSYNLPVRYHSSFMARNRLYNLRYQQRTLREVTKRLGEPIRSTCCSSSASVSVKHGISWSSKNIQMQGAQPISKGGELLAEEVSD